MAVSCRRKHLIYDTMKANDGGGFAFVEVAEDRFADIFSKRRPSIGFSNDGVTQRFGDEAPIDFVFGYLEDNFAHAFSL